MSASYTTVPSGGSVSGVVALDRNQYPVSVECPSSLAAAEVRLQFSTLSGGPFGTYYRPDGSGIPFTVLSGEGPGWGTIAEPAARYARVWLTSSQSDTRSFTFCPVR